MAFRKLFWNYYEGFWGKMDSHIPPGEKKKSNCLTPQSFAYSHLSFTVKRLVVFSHENSSGHQFLSKFVLASLKFWG